MKTPMQQEDVGVEKASASNFSNMSTLIVCNYLEKQEIKGTLETIKSHIKMLCLEAKKSHPFLASCTESVYNDVDWIFVKSLVSGETE